METICEKLELLDLKKTKQPWTSARFYWYASKSAEKPLSCFRFRPSGTPQPRRLQCRSKNVTYFREAVPSVCQSEWFSLSFLVSYDSTSEASEVMDGLSAAASVIAVIQISGTVISLCSQYLTAVKNAKSDIERLQGELRSLETVLEGAQKLVEGPNGVRLETSRPLLDGVRGCSSQLADLKSKLEQNLKHAKTGKIKWIRDRTKWPFESKDVENIIKILNKFRSTISDSLNIDQTYVEDGLLVASLLLMLPLLGGCSSTILNDSTTRNVLRFWNGFHLYHTESTTGRSRRLEHPVLASGYYSTRDSENGRTPVRQ